MFVDPTQLPTAQHEKQEYDLHQNHADDPGYRTFLQKVSVPLLARLDNASEGVDFGCGPGPVLAQMISEQGHSVDLYDPFYCPDTSVFSKRYHFIVATEAIEHFHLPHQEWRAWMTMLKPGGWLAIMTKRVLNKQRFTQWHYKNDPTHVSFFSDNTFAWLANQHDLELDIHSSDVVFMRKPKAI